MKTTRNETLWTVTFIDGVTGTTRTNDVRAKTADVAGERHMASGAKFRDTVVSVEQAA